MEVATRLDIESAVWLTDEEVAEYLGVDIKEVKRLYADEGAFVKYEAGHNLISKQSVMDYIDGKVSRPLHTKAVREQRKQQELKQQRDAEEQERRERINYLQSRKQELNNLLTQSIRNYGEF